MAMDRQAVVTNVHRALRTTFVNLNSTVALISEDGIIAGDKKLYKSIEDVVSDFTDPTSEFVKLAKAFFAKGSDSLWAVPMAQDITPATAGTLTTIAIDATNIALLIAMTDAEFAVSVDGTSQDVVSVDLTTVTDLAGIAGILDGKISGAGVSVLNDTLVITSDTTGVASDVTSITAVSGGSGTDISATIASQSTSSGTPSSSSYDIVQKLTDLSNDATDGFDFIAVILDHVIGSSDQVDSADLAKYVFNKEYAVFLDTTDAGAKDGTSAGILAMRAFYSGLSGDDRMKNGNVVMFYTDKADDYVASGYVGTLLSRDIGYMAPKFIKPIESSPIILTGGELGMILASNVNVYTGTNERTGRAFIKEGTTLMDNVYVDTMLGGIWMEVQIENAIYDLLETKKVPMNVDGFTLLESVVLPVFKQGVLQGIINGNAGGQTTFKGDVQPTNIFGYAIKFRAGDVNNREVIGQYCYFDNIATHFVTNEVCIKLIEQGA